MAEEQEQEQVATVSVVYQPSGNILPTSPDTVLLSSDRVVFYLHSEFLRQRSSNFFEHLLTTTPAQAEPDRQPPVLPVREDSQVLNVLLHTVYGMPCGQFYLSKGTLAAVVVGLYEDGISLNAHVVPGTPLFALLCPRDTQGPTGAIQSLKSASPKHGR